MVISCKGNSPFNRQTDQRGERYRRCKMRPRWRAGRSPAGQFLHGKEMIIADFVVDIGPGSGEPTVDAHGGHQH